MQQGGCTVLGAHKMPKEHRPGCRPPDHRHARTNPRLEAELNSLDCVSRSLTRSSQSERRTGASNRNISDPYRRRNWEVTLSCNLLNTASGGKVTSRPGLPVEAAAGEFVTR